MPYYTSIRRGSDYGFLAGPFRTHTEALALVDDARRMANRVRRDEAAFAGFGTARANNFVTGRLNADLGIEIDPETGYARICGALRSKYQLALHARITGPQTGRKHTDEYQWKLEADRRKINDYLFRRIRHTGSRNFLSTLEMQRRYPHINNQEDDTWQKIGIPIHT